MTDSSNLNIVRYAGISTVYIIPAEGVPTFAEYDALIGLTVEISGDFTPIYCSESGELTVQTVTFPGGCEQRATLKFSTPLMLNLSGRAIIAGCADGKFRLVGRAEEPGLKVETTDTTGTATGTARVSYTVTLSGLCAGYEVRFTTE